MKTQNSEIIFSQDADGNIRLLTMFVAPKGAKKESPFKSFFNKLKKTFHSSDNKENYIPSSSKNIFASIRSNIILKNLSYNDLCDYYESVDTMASSPMQTDANKDEEKDSSNGIQFQVVPLKRVSAVDQVRDEIIKLINLGFTDEQIMEIIKGCRNKKRILINQHFKVFVVEQNAMVEVEMNPLSKTLFLFYLKHPEGVALKCLSDYKAELSHIYSRLTGRESVEDIEKSIQDMVDPTSNSVHEKCSRIKAAFKDKVSSTTITDYVPSGKQGEPRFISLDRNLVTWEGSL